MTHATSKQNSKDGDSTATAAERARVAYLADLRTVFNNPAGQRVLAILRTSSGCGRPAVILPAGGGPIDPFLTHWRDGRRSLILEIDEHLATPEDAGPPGGPAAIR